MFGKEYRNMSYEDFGKASESEKYRMNPERRDEYERRAAQAKDIKEGLERRRRENAAEEASAAERRREARASRPPREPMVYTEQKGMAAVIALGPVFPAIMALVFSFSNVFSASVMAALAAAGIHLTIFMVSNGEGMPKLVEAAIAFGISGFVTYLFMKVLPRFEIWAENASAASLPAGVALSVVPSAVYAAIFASFGILGDVVSLDGTVASFGAFVWAVTQGFALFSLWLLRRGRS